MVFGGLQSCNLNLQMTYLVLPQMVERGKGAIVNMSAGGCTRPSPQMAVYAATKVCSFSSPYCRLSAECLFIIFPHFALTNLDQWNQIFLCCCYKGNLSPLHLMLMEPYPSNYCVSLPIVSLWTDELLWYERWKARWYFRVVPSMSPSR